MATNAPRVIALRELLARASSPFFSDSSLPAAVVACCEDLINAGDSLTALELIGEARAGDWLPNADGLRLGLLEGRALRMLGRLGESLEVLREAANAAGALLDRMFDEKCMLQILEAASLWRMNRVEEAIAILERVHSELLGKPDSCLLSYCAFELSSAHFFAGDDARARASGLEALVSGRRCGSDFHTALALDHLARLDKQACRWPNATDYSRAALDLFEKGGHRLHCGISHRGLGIISWKKGRPHQAMEHASLAESAFEQLGSFGYRRTAVLLKAVVLLHSGAFATANSLLERDENHVRESRVILLTIEYLGDIHLEQGEAEAALRHYDDAWPKAYALVPKGDIVAELRRRRAECYLLLGRFDEARDEAIGALKHCRELGDRYEEAATFRILALTMAALGKPSEAKSWFDQGFAIYEDIETPYEWGKLWMAYGDWLSGENAGTYADRDGALEAYRIALEHFERMGAEAKRAEALTRIQRIEPDSPAAAPSLPAAIASYKRPARRPRAQSELDRRSAWARETFGFVTRNRAVLVVLDEAAKLAATKAPVLILGESGSGKELIASAIHQLSKRTGQYMPLNCASIGRDVFESEMFGHMAGSFTGATRDKAGIFESCDGGTVFLDEVAEMPSEQQARLLRYLESGEFRRIGATRNTRADTRVVAATNRDHAVLRSGERFRHDLYFRLAHGVVILPPLRQRGDDIALLIDHFLAESCAELNTEATFSPDAMKRMLAYAWPGNVRELRAVIRRAVVFASPGTPIPASRLDLEEGRVPTNLQEETNLVERRRIEQALKQTHGVKSDAARILGLSRTTLISKMKRFGLMD